MYKWIRTWFCQLYYEISDSLSSFEIGDSKNYILSKISNESHFYRFINDIDSSIQSKKLYPENIISIKSDLNRKQNYEEQGLSFISGKYKEEFIIGYLNLSRIYLDNNRQIGIFHLDYLGGPDCGYKEFVLIEMIEDNWDIYKIIRYGFY